MNNMPETFCTTCGVRTQNGVCPNCGTPIQGNNPPRTAPQSQSGDPIFINEGANEEIKNSMCPVCGMMNTATASECNSCGNLLPASFGSPETLDLNIVKRISETDRSHFFLIGLGLINKFLRDKHPDYKLCFRCGEPMDIGEQFCKRCRHPSTLNGIEELFKGNYDESLLHDLNELFPEFGLQEWTNAAYLPYDQLVTMKIDCETIASIMATILRSLAVFLRSATQRTQLPASVQPFLDVLKSRVDTLPNLPQPPARPVPSGEIASQMRRTDRGPQRPWNT